MITIAVCDDDRLFAAKLKEKIRYLCACCLPERIECHVEAEFCSGSDVLVYLENHPINILFLDIDMPEMSGFTIAEQLNRKHPDTLLLFVSAHEQFVYSSFEYSPFRFLRKSHLEAELPNALVKAVESFTRTKEMLLFSTTDGDIWLPARDILFFEGQRNYYLIHTVSTVYRCRGTMSQAEAMVEQLDFFRIHVGYIINLENIEKLCGTNTVQMKNGAMLPISQRRLAEFRSVYMQFTRRRYSV